MLGDLPTEVLIDIMRYLSSSDALIIFAHVPDRLYAIACQQVARCLTFDSNMSISRFRAYFRVEHPRINHLVTRLRIDDFMHLNELVLCLSDTIFPRLERFYMWGRYETRHLINFLSHPNLLTLRHVHIDTCPRSYNYPVMDILVELISGRMKMAPLETLKLVYRADDPPPIAQKVRTLRSDFKYEFVELAKNFPVMILNCIVHLTLTISEQEILWLCLRTCPMPSLILLDVIFEYDANSRFNIDNLITTDDKSDLSKLCTFRLKNSPFIFIQGLLNSFSMPRINTVCFLNVYDNDTLDCMCSNDSWSQLLTTRLPHLKHFELKLLIDPIPSRPIIDKIVQSFRLDPVLSRWPVGAFVDERFNNHRGSLHWKEVSRLILHTLPYPGKHDLINEFWNWNVVSNERKRLHIASHIDRYVTWYVNETIRCGDSLNQLSKLIARNMRSLRFVYWASNQYEQKPDVDVCFGSGLCREISELTLEFVGTENVIPPVAKFNLVERLFITLAPFIRKLEINTEDMSDECWLLCRPLFVRQHITHLNIHFKRTLNDNFSPLEHISSNFPFITHLSVTDTYMRRAALARVAVEFLCHWPQSIPLQRLHLGYLYPNQRRSLYQDFEYVRESIFRSLAAHGSSGQESIVFDQSAILIWR